MGRIKLVKMILLPKLFYILWQALLYLPQYIQVHGIYPQQVQHVEGLEVPPPI